MIWGLRAEEAWDSQGMGTLQRSSLKQGVEYPGREGSAGSQGSENDPQDTDRKCGWSVACRRHSCPWTGKWRPDPASLECHAEDFRLDTTGRGEQALKQEPEGPLPSSPPEPLLLKAPVLFWERKSANKPQGPTCKGLMGKEVRQVWGLGGFKPQSFNVGGDCGPGQGGTEC